LVKNERRNENMAERSLLRDAVERVRRMRNIISITFE